MLIRVYSIFRFIFELATVFIIGYWGFSLRSLQGWRYIIGIAAPLIIVLVWSIWGAPSSVHRLAGILRLALELGIYLTAAVCLIFLENKQMAIIFGVVGLANGIINYLMQVQI